MPIFDMGEYEMQAKFGIERELDTKFRLIDYHNGNGDFHFHSQIEVCAVTDGELEALVNNHRRRLQAGDISVAMGYDTHLYTPVTDATFSVLIFPNEVCADFVTAVGERKITDPFLCKKEVTDAVSVCLQEIREHADNPLMTKGNLYLILGLIAQNVSFGEETASDRGDLISQILVYLHNRFAEDITLASVAAEFGYHPAYVSRLFQSRLNLGLNRYVNILRLKKAVSLLKTQKHGTLYCALESGFHSLRTFYRVFESEFGCSPKEYFRQENEPQNLSLLHANTLLE